MASKFPGLLLPDVNHNPTATHRVPLQHSGQHAKHVFEGLIVSKPHFCCFSVEFLCTYLGKQPKIVRMGESVQADMVTLLVFR